MASIPDRAHEVITANTLEPPIAGEGPESWQAFREKGNGHGLPIAESREDSHLEIFPEPHGKGVEGAMGGSRSEAGESQE
jgi:hypothetical protein